MKNTPNKRQEALQLAVDWLNKWMESLEKRIRLLGLNDPQTMKAAERERAASRYYMVLLDLLELRMEYTQAIADEIAEGIPQLTIADLIPDPVVGLCGPQARRTRPTDDRSSTDKEGAPGE